jgi:hypothetical protein
MRKVKAGDRITEGLFNELIAIANRAQLTVSQGCGLSLIAGPHGYTLSASIPRPIWGKVTGPLASGTYPFTQQFPGTGGTWTAGTLSDVAYESNGNPNVPLNSIVELQWMSTGDWRFTLGSC